ncbi:NADP-dependent oxidoreductase domain-containing protein [Protomyces lactucae-debilis]|uniref:GCS light chain n=1 Tax=Protomyces lactucae-debilis TaxID=2754530 RepID=A0A1Y2FK49_PROLT|nr:NADP-dependent oxidoreductase domain-containing protein [Protomyces lactucae-debilis]ORY84353.1 NADP-dependent oxidoreductase domain-containing protein [Protomyces lactucae-debilis]
MVARILQSDNAMRLSPNHTALSDSNAELIAALKQSLATNDSATDDALLSEDRDEYEITLKLFFTPDTTAESRSEDVARCVDATIEQLKVKSVDLLILAFPGIVLDAEDEEDAFDEASLKDIAKVYQAAQDLVAQGKAKGLGVSEFSAARLKQLYDTAAEYNDAGLPTVNQINLKDCCVMPADLIALAKDRNIKLFTHGDLKEMLPQAQLDDLMVGTDAQTRFTAKWVSKVTCVVKSRGVVEFKGYAAMIES